MSIEIFNYKFDDLFDPTLKSLHILGGSASAEEIEENVANILSLSDEKINDIQRGNITKLSYRLAWARNYLKKAGLVEKSDRGVWSLTTKGLNCKEINKEEIKKHVHDLDKSGNDINEEINKELEIEENAEIKELNWQEQALEILKTIPPENFERLCQRLLRELGFINVEVTGKVGDGGIDGKGVYRVGGIMSFHVVFQCKRFIGTISPSIVRDFRGAFIGRADKGLLITTGTFTREAKKEAQRDGAPPIDLVDGFDLIEKLKELKLGINVEMVEKVTVSADWYRNF